MSVDKAAAEGLLRDVANVLGDVARAMQRGQATPSLLAQAREQAGLNVAIAQARATLYLAEQTASLVKQQRTANLIAYTQAEGGPYKFINWTDGANEKVLTLIREGLGVS